MKKYWVTMYTNYEVISVEEIDETLKDGEPKEKDKNSFGWPITDATKHFLKGGVTRITASGVYTVEVEAESEEEAKHLAPMVCLKKRVQDLEESLKRESQARVTLLDQKNELLLKNGKSIDIFMSIIRSGELTIVDTGKRIIGTWFDVVGEKEFETGTRRNFELLVEDIKNARVRDDDCY